MERLYEAGLSFVLWVFAAMGAGIVWLVRRVLTNQAEIAMLRQHIEARDNLRSEDREALGDVRDSVKRIESWIMERGK